MLALNSNKYFFINFKSKVNINFVDNEVWPISAMNNLIFDVYYIVKSVENLNFINNYLGFNANIRNYYRKMN